MLSMNARGTCKQLEYNFLTELNFIILPVSWSASHNSTCCTAGP